jgi:hypothetical protein
LEERIASIFRAGEQHEFTGKQVIADWSSEERNTELRGKTGGVGKQAMRIDCRGGCVQGGWPGNIKPRWDRIGRRGEREARLPGCR